MVFYVDFLASVVVGIPYVFVERKNQMTVLTAENTMPHMVCASGWENMVA